MVRRCPPGVFCFENITLVIIAVIMVGGGIYAHSRFFGGHGHGYLEFDRNGQHFKLEPVTEDNELFLVIRDATSGKTTYAASRFLYASLPDKNGITKLDFNKAYNPPCVFTAFATCPLPPQQNRMTVAVEAGEKKYKGH